jgi:cerevisin
LTYFDTHYSFKILTSSLQILAWNGGGSANYTEIVAKGGYKTKALGDEVDELIIKAQEVVNEELGAIYSHIKDAVVA